MSMNRRNNHVSPIYAMMIVWLGWTLLLPLFALAHYIPLIILATAVYNLVNSMAKRADRQKQQTARAEPAKKEQPAQPDETKKSTGNPEVDALIEKRDDAISEMRRLNMNIEDEKITAQINDMEYTTSRIFDYVIAHPDKVSQISKFLNYYLPTTIKLLNTYDKMNSQGVKGENISTTMAKVENTLDMVVGAFHKQLDTLFAGDALDVSSDITVMENLMKTEGLADSDLDTEIKLTLSE